MKKGLLQQLDEGLVIGDGGYVIALEKRGYVMGGAWTPEAAIEHPEAVRQLHREFLRAGSTALQAFTFYSSDDKLKYNNRSLASELNCVSLNDAACKIALEVAAEGENVLVAGGICLNPAYTEGKGKQYIQQEVKKQCDLFVKNKIDFIICEFFCHVEEIVWTIEEAKKTGLPVVATMCIGKTGDGNGVPLEECAIKMAKTKADVVGLNCMYDPFMALESMEIFKKALDKEGLKPYLGMQPNGFFTTGTGKLGYTSCPEYPFAMEARVITRFDSHKYARKAYELGVRYIGGCCGFEAHHIRAIAEELSEENGGQLPPASQKHMPWGGAMIYSNFPHLRKRADKSYWEKLIPHSGRPEPPTFELPQN